jgi:hypothetical protein
MGEDYFIVNLKGDFADNQKTKALLGNCNPFQGLFAVCLRVPDFIPIREDRPSKKTQEVWMVHKVYAVLTYLPFFHVHIALLAALHRAVQPPWYKLQKEEEILSRNLQRNLT